MTHIPLYYYVPVRDTIRTLLGNKSSPLPSPLLDVHVVESSGKLVNKASAHIPNEFTQVYLLRLLYLRLNLDGMSLLKNPPPTGPGLGRELTSVVGVPSYRVIAFTGGGRRLP